MAETPIKRCSKCKQEYPRSPVYFSRSKNQPDGLYPQCLQCRGSRFRPWLEVAVPDGFRCCRRGTECVAPSGAVQPETDEFFYWNAHKKLDPICKCCRRAIQDAWYQENRQHARVQQKDYYQRNRAHLKAKTHQWYWSHRDQSLAWHRNNRHNNAERLSIRRRRRYQERGDMMRAAGRASYQRHRIKRREQAKQYRLANPERVAAQQRASAKRNRDHIRAYQRRWVNANRAKDRARSRNYKIRKRGAPGTHTGDDILLLLKSQKGLCWWCGKLVGDNYHVDHRIPLARGGSNAPENLCISCPTCNMSKQDKLPQEWNGRLL